MQQDENPELVVYSDSWVQYDEEMPSTFFWLRKSTIIKIRGTDKVSSILFFVEIEVGDELILS